MITKKELEKQAQTMGYLPLEWKKGDPLPKWVPLNTALELLEDYKGALVELADLQRQLTEADWEKKEAEPVVRVSVLLRWMEGLQYELKQPGNENFSALDLLIDMKFPMRNRLSDHIRYMEGP